MLYPTYPSFDDKVPYYFIDFETRESVQDVNDVFYNQSFLIEWQNASDLVNVSLWQLPPTENDRANTVFIDALGCMKIDFELIYRDLTKLLSVASPGLLHLLGAKLYDT